ncbi:NAD-dependent epimerase/dehydratase family protein [Halalkalicoccus jeotgali]|uniref:NAD-dependent epimerase/dehydratase n=1 Tax=Halalkalicoccus jeotgali (strain DSM 18796 / CECT 7217 / JCM 14584 / KCTC 4019 / B3) TaxID=795797 RepID=D8J7H9_HALJB|nr:NAD-dependent epimerase/dehydratase family protein [Halalkalicoccus jeotgali]ADJ14074.1 NAD-dependent epimerase/dehydratase [Halalkalicoccus jeotgali B3]ELY33882.1 NAD-dependent epimerase/dehydratase [Halalkalicoccus jeotgali B3]
MNILITGGAGFIGSHLVDALVADHEVTVLDDFSSGRRSNVHDSATVVEGDVRDEQTIAEAAGDVDVIFHEAASVSVERSVAEPEYSHAVNVDATLSLLETARKRDARCVLASSAAVYGEPASVPIPESEPLAPTSPYGIEKTSIDQYARVYNELYDLPTVALRYFNVYGPRQTAGDYSGVISTFLDQARANDPITVHGDGTQTRDFVHVEDVVRVNLLAMETDHVGEAYNVGTGDTVTIAELARAVREVVGSDSEIVHTEGRAGDINHSCAEITKARERLGYEPTVPLADGLGTLT